MQSGSRVLRLFAEHGTLFVFVLLCGFFSIATMSEQYAEGATAAEDMANRLSKENGPGTKITIIGGHGTADLQFADVLEQLLQKKGLIVSLRIVGHPPDVRQALKQHIDQGNKPEVLVLSRSASRWSLFEKPNEKIPGFGEPRIAVPLGQKWPNFLKAENLLNIANQIAVIAILAAGMTLVIITGGIDLSVGSLIALSAVIVALIIQRFSGAENASSLSMVMAGVAAMVACGLVGVFSGFAVTRFAIPSFIVTLGTMLIASGLAYILSDGQSIYQIPDRFVWLGRGADLGGVPNAVVLMLLIYLAVHIVMTRTTLGRAIYAVGGNAEAARLAGIRVRSVIIFVFALSGILAGLGGVIMASQLKSGSPTYGQVYELYVIAAVVVGGTSLQGGEGRVSGTLIGALLIAVIQNGMNLTGVESYTQKVVLGAIIIGAVLIDRLKHSRR